MARWIPIVNIKECLLGQEPSRVYCSNCRTVQWKPKARYNKMFRTPYCHKCGKRMEVK